MLDHQRTTNANNKGMAYEIWRCLPRSTDPGKKNINWEVVVGFTGVGFFPGQWSLGEIKRNLTVTNFIP
jgi:hypothetical protein